MALGKSCAKLILSGEHAVVYGHPGIALPCHQLQATVLLTPHSGSCVLQAPDIGFEATLSGPLESHDNSHPLLRTLQHVLRFFEQETYPECELRFSSEIPLGRGLGSGTAISTALMRTFAHHFEQPLSPETLHTEVNKIEALYHGTPSGIDSTIMAYGRPLWFRKGLPPEWLTLQQDLPLMILDSGQGPPTSQVVAAVARARETDPRARQTLEHIAQITTELKTALATGSLADIGQLMTRNQQALKTLGLSTPLIDTWVNIAQKLGAYGAKLSGAGQGGIVLVLYPPAQESAFKKAFQNAGCDRLYTCVIPAIIA